MYTDSTGYAWWHVAIGVVIIGGLFIAANIATGGLASVLGSAAWGALAGGSISALFGGLSTTVEGKLTFNFEDASRSFMVGSIAGGIAGGLSSASHLVGETLIKTTTIMKRIGYIAMQTGINSLLSASVTAVSGLTTGTFSWNSIMISAAFGAFSGAIGTFPGISDGARGLSIGIGLGFAEGSVNEAIEWNRIWSDNQGTLIFDFGV
jgi:hypothetical protein